MNTAQETLFPELSVIRGRKGQKRDPVGRYDTRDRFEAYERKIERLKGTIKYLLSISSVHADAIRKRDEEIRELKFQLSRRNSIEE